MSGKICALLVLILFFAPSIAITSNTGILSYDEKKAYSVGDSVIFTIIVDVEKEKAESLHNWEFLPKENNRWWTMGPIIIDRDSLKKTSNDVGSVVLTFRAIASDAGSNIIPKFSIKNKENGLNYEIDNQPNLEASSLLTKEEEGKAQWTLGLLDYGGYNKLTIALIALFVFSLLFLLIRLIYKKIVQAGKPKPQNALELALAELKKLHRFSSGKITTLEQWKIFAYGLVNILKQYCENNFDFQTSDLTDRELIQQLRARTAHSQNIDILENILNELDQVRYGKKDLDILAAPKLLTNAKSFAEKNYINKNTSLERKKV